MSKKHDTLAKLKHKSRAVTGGKQSQKPVKSIVAKPADVAWDKSIQDTRNAPYRSDSPLSQEEKENLTEQLENDKQRRGHQEKLFCSINLACFFMYCSFIIITWVLYTHDFSTLKLNPFFLIPLSLTGVLPTAIVLSLLKGLYKFENKNSGLTKEDVTAFSHIASICRMIK